MNLQLVPGTLPVGWCPTGATALQEIYDEFFALGVAVYPTSSGWTIKVSDKTSYPSAAEENNTLWVPTTANRPLGIFKYQDGYWCWPNHVEASGVERRFGIFASEADVWSYDGGSGANPATNVPTDFTGAMWEVDHDMDARFAVGAGTTAGGTVLALNASGGEDEHTLTVAELPEHDHEVIMDRQDTEGGDQPNTIYDGTDHGAVEDGVSRRTEMEGSGDPHNNLPPYKVGYWIKRTARIYYTPADL